MEEMRETNIEELKHLLSERALTGETMLLNMGPHHPATHGVLRVLVELDGETIVNAIPDIGFLHTGVEKNMEAKTYQKAEVMTDRLDYMNPPGNNLVYSLAVEKLLDLDVPPRAQSIRVIMAELTRLSSHLLWLGTSGLDVGAISPFLYCMREREILLDIFELVSGARMMTTYIRPGGVWRDVPVEFEAAVKNVLQTFPARVDEYLKVLGNNPIFKDRTQNVGVIDSETCQKYCITGPVLRAAGPAHDLRKAQPYSGYEQYEFDIPTAASGDVFGRFMVRVEEMRQSLRIIEQALNKMPYGPVRSNNHKYVPPPRSEIGTSMESLIHHFKLWTEGYCPPVGSVYQAIESPRGELGVFLESDGGPKPYRIHYRTPSFANLQILPLIIKGRFVADVVACIASIDIVLGDCDR
jgi:NADH-quinone oxidoreductase subunit D